ncbi:hypothetical protein VTJ04DRAFT_3897 [Mycothermus thermophilus]|uniref:uncharacterized protein n=1 Tax=Humicola insolens TaxID=85995 RepID=UPI0037448FE6
MERQYTPYTPYSPRAGPAPQPAGVPVPPPPSPRRIPDDRLQPSVPYPYSPGRPASRGADPFPELPAGRTLRPQKSMPELTRRPVGSDTMLPPPPPPMPTAATFGPGGVGDVKQQKTVMQKALSEAQHFAGGLIPHPTESTKHYTILRHSPPLIWYRGPGTSIAITIFSSPDHPLPADRTLWLQQRGLSGDTGMKVKQLFNATDSWLHVTPATQVLLHQIDADTERSWQRDISKAAKKLVKEKGPNKAHVPRETHVIRIPEASDDGYFRLVLCTGKGTPNDIPGSGSETTSSKCKTLCSSPIFRVASASTDSSVFRGASLKTLPLEMGVFVGSKVATATVDRYTAPVRAPINALKGRFGPGFVAQTVGGLVRDGVSERSAEREAERHEAFMAAHRAHVARALQLQADPNAVFPIGSDAGPEAPFPVKFQGSVVRGTGRSEAELGFPTANLSGVPDEVRYRLNGVYFGWACVRAKGSASNGNSRSQATTPTTPTAVSGINSAPFFPPPPPPGNTEPPGAAAWHKSVISITANPYAAPSVTPKPLVTVHLLSLPPGHTNLVGATLKVLVLGLLRPVPPSPQLLSPRDRLDAVSRDICLTLVSLAREQWQPDSWAVRGRLEEDRGIGDRLESAKGKVLGKVLPDVIKKGPAAKASVMNKIGVRGEDGEERDRLRGVGGYWVARG